MDTICFNHSKKYMSFCSSHDMKCCQHCVSESHQNCQVHQLKQVGIEKVEDDLRNLTLEFQAIETFLLEMKSKIGDQRKKGLEEIAQVRINLQNQLANLEKKMIEDISCEYEKFKSETECTIKQIGDEKIKVQKMLDKLTGLKLEGTDDQLLCAVTSSKKELREMHGFLDGVKESGVLFEKNMSVDVNLSLTSFDKNIESFGEVTILSSPPILPNQMGNPTVTRYKALMATPDTNISLRMCYTLTFPRQMKITGCTRLPDGKHVFVDRHNKRLVLNESGNFRDIFPFAISPFDVCHVKNNIVAVTLPETNEVVYVDILKGIPIKSLFFKNKCRRIESNGEFMVIGFPRYKRVIVADLDGTEIRSFIVSCRRFTLGSYEIYSVNTRRDEVLCYDLSGKEIWTYPDVVCMPAGIVVDRRGHVYVFSKFNKALYLISRYGTTNRILENNAIEDHNDFSCLYMHPDSDELLVCSYSTQATIYMVER